MLSKDFIENQKNWLENEMKRLNEGIRSETEEGYLNGSAREVSGELTFVDNHMADSATELYERSKNLALEDHQREEIEKIHRALQAIEDGTYGQCAECGREISAERLETIPYTIYCTEHTPDQTISDDRPAEEEILEQTHRVSFERRANVEMEDNKNSLNEVANYGTSEVPGDFEGDQADYDSLYSEKEEIDGYAEDYESFVASDLEGNVTYLDNDKKKDYEEMLDDEGMESQLGDIPYRKRDSYLDEKAKKK